MEVDDSPITSDDIIGKIISLGMCLLSSLIDISENAFITGCPDWMFMQWNLENTPASTQQFDDFNVFALSKLRFFFVLLFFFFPPFPKWPKAAMPARLSDYLV